MKAVRALFLTILAAGLLVAAAAPAAAQADRSSDETQAQKTRQELTDVLKQYPPALGSVLKLDNSLISSDAYLAPYPNVVTFLAKHPEVRRNPTYFLTNVRSSSDDSYQSYVYDPKQRAWDNMMEMMAVLVVILTIVGTLGWLVRTAVDYRRWGRLSKVQADAHAKLLDRFTGNDELLAYVQSPAGARFLKSSPISLDGNPQTMAAPISRIHWSMQLGVVMTSAGIGLNYVSRHVDPNRADPLFTLSVILLSLGIGFAISAVVSYLMSSRLGMLPGGNRTEPNED